MKLRSSILTMIVSEGSLTLRALTWTREMLDYFIMEELPVLVGKQPRKA
jgi:hypothetical protein